jgi:Holliday junction resolvase RusA-like endonuclease
VRLVLPPPPSTNALFTHRFGSRQRIKTDAYRQWIADAGWLARSQNPGSMPDRVPLSASMELPFSRRRDIDNAKAIADLLTHLGIIGDDRWIDEWHIRRVPVGQPLVVEVRELEEKDGRSAEADAAPGRDVAAD